MSRNDTANTNSARDIAKRLVHWYGRTARDLPWRNDPTPYGIWVSEIMCQQTRAETAAKYWIAWMQALPNVESLSRADETQLLNLWQGLGYYSRVRNLQRAAIEIVANHDGVLPSDPRVLLTLPGIGAYTAAAIASIAFCRPCAAIDGNVIRVVTRVEAIENDVARNTTQSSIASTAQRWMDEAVNDSPLAPRALTQALMELGATHCSPRNPRCDRCPIEEHCLAKRAGLQAQLPVKTKRAKALRKQWLSYIVWNQGAILLTRRPKNGINAGYWELPTVETEEKTSNPQHEAERQWGLRLPSLQKRARITHAITKFRIEIEIHTADLPERTMMDGVECRWARPDELAALPLTAATLKALQEAID